MSTRRRVGVIGTGAIGSQVAAAVAAGKIAGAELECVVTRSPADVGVDLDTAVRRCDVLVECAGQQVVAESAEHIMTRGLDLLISSVGALADAALAQRLAKAGPGRLFWTAGAVGGLDLLGAAAQHGDWAEVLVRTTKLPPALVRPWMDADQVAALLGASAPVTVFSGPAREAAALFPQSLNVAAAVALTVGDWARTRVELVADPAAELTRHVIEARGAAGRYCFDIRNHPSAQNPRTSGIVPAAVLRSLSAIVGSGGRAI